MIELGNHLIERVLDREHQKVVGNTAFEGAAEMRDCRVPGGSQQCRFRAGRALDKGRVAQPVAAPDSFGGGIEDQIEAQAAEMLP